MQNGRQVFGAIVLPLAAMVCAIKTASRMIAVGKIGMLEHPKEGAGGRHSGIYIHLGVRTRRAESRTPPIHRTGAGPASPGDRRFRSTE